MYYLIIFLLCCSVYAMEKSQSANDFETGQKKIALSLALHSNKLEEVKSIINEMPNYLKKSKTPWVYDAVPFGPEMIKPFVDQGAEVNITNPEDGWSPLMRAAATNMPDVVQYLLTKGADVNQTAHDGSTPLTQVQLCQLAKIQTILLEHSAK